MPSIAPTMNASLFARVSFGRVFTLEGYCSGLWLSAALSVAGSIVKVQGVDLGRWV